MTEPLPREKNLDKIIQAIGKQGGTADTSPPYERAKAELLAICSETLVESIDKNSTASQKLSEKIYWLNVILTSATVIGTGVAIMAFLFKQGN